MSKTRGEKCPRFNSVYESDISHSNKNIFKYLEITVDTKIIMYDIISYQTRCILWAILIEYPQQTFTYLRK